MWCFWKGDIYGAEDEGCLLLTSGEGEGTSVYEDDPLNQIL